MISSPEQRRNLVEHLIAYASLPYFEGSLPGNVFEQLFAFVREAKRLDTYDYIDVFDEKTKSGWQNKSTLAGTPLTWKRVKIADKASMMGFGDTQTLGDKIIDFCNENVKSSFDKYNLESVGYSRLILSGNSFSYFERILCTKDDPRVFRSSDFEWRWSTPKSSKKKEQLPALHGFHKLSGDRWFAWHGKGENQLHFNGEKHWIADADHTSFEIPSQKLTLNRLKELIVV